MTGLPLGDEDGDGIDKPIGREVIVVSVLLLCCLLSFLSSPLVASSVESNVRTQTSFVSAVWPLAVAPVYIVTIFFHCASCV